MSICLPSYDIVYLSDASSELISSSLSTLSRAQVTLSISDLTLDATFFFTKKTLGTIGRAFSIRLRIFCKMVAFTSKMRMLSTFSWVVNISAIPPDCNKLVSDIQIRASFTGHRLFNVAFILAAFESDMISLHLSTACSTMLLTRLFSYSGQHSSNTLFLFGKHAK